jgi:hypothetical protein
MSKIRKRPWSHPRMGDPQAQNIKAARLIKDQNELDLILAKAPSPAIAEGWLKAYGPHLKFVPVQLRQ